MLSLTFPLFEKLSINHKQLIEKITRKFPPYSDFNFLSLWSWNINSATEISFINDNLIIKLSDYITNETIYSFLGNGGYPVACALFEFLKNRGENEIIKLVPEEVVKDNDIQNQFLVTEDRDNFDYILSTEQISLMVGKKLHQKRKKLNKFTENYNPKVIIKNIKEKNIELELLNFFNIWGKEQYKSTEKIENELNALLRLLNNPEFFGEIPIICVYENGNLIGFSIFELLDNHYAVGSFQKANIKYEGIYEFINQQLAFYALKNGYKYINIEQDLGIPGLRNAKQNYNPTFLKKYTISKK